MELPIKISEWARENFCSYLKTLCYNSRLPTCIVHFDDLNYFLRQVPFSYNHNHVILTVYFSYFPRCLTWFVLMTANTCSQPVEKTVVCWCGKLTLSKCLLFRCEECGQPCLVGWKAKLLATDRHHIGYSALIQYYSFSLPRVLSESFVPLTRNLIVL